MEEDDDDIVLKGDEGFLLSAEVKIRRATVATLASRRTEVERKR